MTAETSRALKQTRSVVPAAAHTSNATTSQRVWTQVTDAEGSDEWSQAQRELFRTITYAHVNIN